ncbi:PD-(D/E)XK nuclease family protein [Pseudomonas sp. NY11955]|uniref:PD-(D/E)XK nuclease family protein n=1 Tax=Pseudomonas sp. NY11955 TaxID=3400363 RepID=UPI003A86FFA1
MLITFGMQLDGQRATQPGNRLGALTVGPQGLLDILEGQLGLLALRPCAAQRAAAYRACLAQCDNGQRFYHASFSADQLGVAATLLAWRDDLYLHGWDGRPCAVASQRINDLAEVEADAREVVPASTGQRLQRVAEALATRRTGITNLYLSDAWEVYPLAWQRVLQRLPRAQLPSPSGDAPGFLGQLQAALRSSVAGTPVGPVPWQDDGSVRLVQAQTRTLAATWLSRTLPQGPQTLLVATADGSCLDSHLAGANQARHGLTGSSLLRPALQVLPLAMELLWAPLNYPALLQFLSHPISPVRLFARRQLASKISSMPGIVGAEWDRMLERISAYYGPDAQSVRTSIEHWLQAPTFAPDKGAALSEVQVRVQRLQAFFQARLGHQDPAQRHAAQAGHGQCEATLQALAALEWQGVEYLRPRQLQQVIEQATATGSDNPLLKAQAGAYLTVSRPGAAIEPVDTVTWWNLAMPALPTRSPWSNAERRQWAGLGVALPDGAAQLAQAAQDWLRPVLAARRQLTLVLAPPQEEAHPLWQLIETVVNQPQVQALEDLMRVPGPLCQAQALHALPPRKRWWKLPAGTPLAAPEKASYTSLNLLLFNPYHWLLQYGAKIQSGNSPSLSDSYRLNGALAHRLAERLFNAPDALTMSADAFDAWFTTHFKQVVLEEGAVLLMGGRGTDLATLRHRVHRAMIQLRSHFAKAKVVAVTTEQPLAGTFEGGALAGSADLVVTTTDEQRAVVDMKWAGGKKYPEQLQANRHLQLAIYAELLRQQTGSLPSVAYFILEPARLLTPDDRVFRDAQQVPANPPGNTRELWQAFVKAWKWRHEQIADGHFELALQGIEEDEASQPPEQALAMEYLKEAYNDYLTLAGWEQ